MNWWALEKDFVLWASIVSFSLWASNTMMAISLRLPCIHVLRFFSHMQPFLNNSCGLFCSFFWIHPVQPSYNSTKQGTYPRRNIWLRLNTQYALGLILRCIAVSCSHVSPISSYLAGHPVYAECQHRCQWNQHFQHQLHSWCSSLWGNSSLVFLNCPVFIAWRLALSGLAFLLARHSWSLLNYLSAVLSSMQHYKLIYP